MTSINSVDLHKNKLTQRFWSKVDKRSDSECWEWVGSKSLGYGNFWVYTKIEKAHRYSWIIHFGSIPDGLLVLHRCDNPSCINPNHLFLGTQKDNMQDMKQKNRRWNNRGERNPNSKLSAEEVIKIKQLLKDKRLSMVKIAEIFGVSFSTIQSISAKKTWS